MSLESLNFDVILHDEDFNKRVKADIAEAENLNTKLSNLLEVKARVSAKREVSIDTKRAENSLERLNEWYRQLEAAEWSKIGKDLNIEPYVAQAIARLKDLEKEINLIQELRKMEGGSGDFYLAEEYKKARAAADGVVASIQALREAQKGLGVDSNSTFREFIDSLTRSDFQLQQMAAHYREMEKSPAKAAAEWKKMEAEYQKTYGTAKAVTAETEKTVGVNKDWEAAQRRIAENLAKEASQQGQAASNAALRQKAVGAVVESQNQLNRLIEQGTAAQEKHNARVREMNANLVNSQSIWRTISQMTGVYFGAAGIRRFVSSLVEVTGNLEMQREAMNHILGNANKGAVIFEQLKELAKPSYFTLPDLTKYAKQLSALSIPYEELFETTKMLGDVSAGLGVSFDRIALAYGHIRSMGFLRGMQARQLTNAGIPIFEELAKNLSKTEEKLVSISDVYDRMSKRQITFAQVKEVFEQMTSEGGKFFDMQIAMTDTLAGRVNKLKGVWQIALSDLGEANSGVLKGSVNMMIKMVEHLDAIGAALKPLIVGLGTYGAALALVATYQSAVNAVRSVEYFIALTQRVNIATAATRAFGSATKAAAGALGILVMAGFGIYEIVKAIRNANNESQQFSKAIKTANDNIMAERNELDKLADTARDATRAMSDRTEAVNTINDKYGEYLRNLGLEKVSVDNLADSYEALRWAIANRYLEELREQAVGSKRSDLNNARSAIADFNAKFLKGRTITDPKTGKTGKAGAGGIGALQGEIERHIDANPLFDQQALTNGIAAIYRRYGIDIKSGDKAVAEIYKVADDYVRANKALQKAEKDFNNFAAGYSQPSNPAANAPKQDFWQVFDTELSKVTDADLQKRLGRLFGYGDERDWETYREKLGKEYDRVSKELEGAFNSERRKPLQQELDFLNRLNTAFGGHLLSGNKTKKREGNAENKEKNAKIAEIKAQIANLQKLREAYDNLVNNPLVGPDNAPALMTQFYGVSKFNFAEQVRTLTEELLKLNPELDEYAQGVLQAFGKDALADYLSSLSAFDSLDDKIQAYLDKDFSLDGEKTTAKVSKAVKELLNKNVKVDFNAEQMIKDLEKAEAKVKTDYEIANKDKWEEEGISEADQKKLADAYWKEWKENRTKEIRAQAAQEKAFNTKATREMVRGFGDDFVKEQLNGFDLSNWGDKTVGQILEIKRILESIELPEEVKAILKKHGLDDILSALQESVSENAGNSLNNTVNPEAMKKYAAYAKKAAGALSNVASELASLTSNFNDANLTAVTEGLSSISQNLEAAAESYEMAASMGAGPYSWIGAVVGGVLDIIKQIIAALNEVEARERAIVEAAKDAKETERKGGLDEKINSYDTLLGENERKRIEDAMEVMEKMREELKGWEDFTFGTKKTNWLEKLGMWISNEKIQEYKEWGTVLGMIQQMGLDLYDENGILNKESIDALQQAFPDIDFQPILNDIDAYYKALDGILEVTKSLFGDIASSAADEIVNSWIEAGNAALDYADILDDVAKRYAKMLIQSTILDSVFDEDKQKQLTKKIMEGDTAGAMEVIAQDMEQISSMAPIFEQILTTLDPYFKREGEDSSNDSSSLGNGIKGITEETASLLASYINAVRADVSFMRALQESGWKNVAAILEWVSSPTLNEYLAQCAANTYDMAQSNRQILSEIQSVIVAPGNTGGMVVKVELA